MHGTNPVQESIPIKGPCFLLLCLSLCLSLSFSLFLSLSLCLSVSLSLSLCLSLSLSLSVSLSLSLISLSLSLSLCLSLGSFSDRFHKFSNIRSLSARSPAPGSGRGLIDSPSLPCPSSSHLLSLERSPHLLP
jgi:hypothetical protein